MKKVMLVFGTRPEAIKMCPLVNELKKRPEVQTVVCVTGQHREMLDAVLHAFGVVPDYDLAIMKDRQTLFDITVNILERIRAVLEEVKPDVVLVHGDTSTTFVTALACFYLPDSGRPCGGRTAHLQHLFSISRRSSTARRSASLPSYNFAPTELSPARTCSARAETPESIYVTGNTAIDALKTTVREDYAHPELEWAAGSRLHRDHRASPREPRRADAPHVPRHPPHY